MKALAERVIECRQPGKSIEIDLNCNGVQLTGWLLRFSRMGLRWRPSCSAFHKDCNSGWNILSTVRVAIKVKAGFCA
jgi:exonuclease V gamma subunit